MLELLKAAAQVGTHTASEALPSEILRFTLEYPGIPKIDAERQRLITLLGGEGFDLFAYSDEDPALLILQFPGVIREQSSDYLFTMADQLVDAMALVSCTPDIDPSFVDNETTAPGVEGVGAIVDAFCSSDAPSPAEANWAIKLMKVDAAWAQFGVTGQGIRVGQPDTGVAAHDELSEGLDKASGFDMIAGTPDPTDPLLTSMGSPGHGTATSSVVISRPGHVISGTAPGATLVPVRCVDRVVLGGGTAVARAIDHARLTGCHVVTMSLGGPFSTSALRRAVVRAVRANMIVLAAAGNCVRVVTYPGWDRNIIAVAAVDNNMKRWKGSCRGAAVDISAPGENVHVARRLAGPAGQTPTPEDLARIDPRGQGTSYAVAQTAGIAALWLEHFGVDAVRAEALKRGNAVVQHLFHAALQASCHTPIGWDVSQMGPGIVDAQALLGLSLAEIPGRDSLGTETAGPEVKMRGTGSDFARHQSEAEFLTFDRALRRDPAQGPALETAVSPMPSPRLAQLIDLGDPSDLPAPAAVVAPATPPVSLSDALKRLGASRGAGLESAAALSTEDAVARIRTEGTDTIMATAESVLKTARARSTRVDSGLQDEALSRIERALVEVAEPDRPMPHDMGEARFALEALVRLTGRPALRITDNDGDLATNPNIGTWAGNLMPARNKWRPKVDAVGRIDVTDPMGRWVHAGTGFVLADGRVMTNRHVLDVFADPLPAAPGQQAFSLRRRASIIFDPDATDESTRFEITHVITAGRNRIGRRVVLTNLDMAIVGVETNNGQQDLPAPMGVTTTTTDAGLENLMVVGYPARPGFQQAPTDAEQALQFWDRVGELYGDEFGVKYISPGMMMSRPGSVANDTAGWAFSHDATTFAGNSGSAIISLHGGMALCGLHFGGSTLTMNLAHDLDTVRAVGDGVFDTDAF
ncbi:S8/S53 family peptidase [Roseovarius sp. M141]|uniref:S8 family serine peptidase n=1 Tax=Roseovarius sp. M141 TaxID=2583806 RepID=UPI0020CC4D9C|nr:S8/S53 family peptidase [Roseovarius sp. M141]